MNRYSRSLTPDIEADILIEKPEYVEAYKEFLVSKGYSYHHSSVRNGYTPISGKRKPIWAFIRPYTGRFGTGVIVCEHRNYDTVICTYYIK